MYPERQVRLYDASEVIVGVWEFLIRASAKDVLALPVEFKDLNAVSLSKEERWFIGYWINGVNAKPATTWSSWARNAHETKSLFWGPTARQLVANAVDKIKHWTIQRCDYSQIKNVEATWFVDPPYQLGGESYDCQPASFEALGTWCKSRLGQVIVCEQEGATWLPFKPLGVKPKGAPGAMKSRGQFTAEVIWHRIGG